MSKKFYILAIILILIIAVYLNRTYSRIYEHNGKVLLSPFKMTSINIPKSNSVKTLTYVSLGDSLSTGVGSDDYKKTITYIFADNLSKKASVNFINLAISGATTSDLIDTQLNEAVELNPDYITLFIGTNDIHNLTSNKKFEENMNYILEKLTQETKAKIIVFNLPYLGSDSLILLPYNLFFDIRTKEFNSILEKIYKDKNLTLIDLYTPTKEIFSKDKSFYSEDGFHPSSEGYLLWGSLFKDNNL